MNAIKVFLVEDEIIIRSGIKQSIDWEKEGYEFVGEASDGELAYPMILKEKPDILLTDIRMPFMDGLELSRLVKQELPNIKILILSGYDEFEYAKEAIQIGVSEYLLKPISSVKLLEVLGTIKKEILQEKEEQRLKLEYSKEMQENLESERIKFFNQLIMGKLSMAEAMTAGKKYGMNLSAFCYSICLFKVLMNAEESENLVNICAAVEEETDKLPFVYAFWRGVDGWAFLLTAESEQQMHELYQIFKNALQKRMSRWKQMEYFGGIGKTVDRIRNLKESFREADKVVAARFTSQVNQILSLQDMQKQKEKEELQMKGVVQVKEFRTMLQKFLNNGTKEEVESFCEAYIARMENDNLRSTIIRQYVIVDICIVVLSFCEQLSCGEALQNEAEELKLAMQKTHFLSEIRKYMERLLKRAIELRDTVSGRRYSDIIATAKEEIAGRYMTDDISLNNVASCVGMSPSYFSSIFSKEVGKTFVEYLTEVRMTKAKEYLICSSMKTSEIGYEVGYKDPHYFSYIFKKTQGCSPKEYRSRRKG